MRTRPSTSGALRKPSGRRRLELALLLALPGCFATVIDPSPTGGTRGTSGSIDTAGAPAAAHAFGWCEAQPILASKCGRCHGTPVEHGAPFPLSAYSDTQVVDSRGRPRYERMHTAIEADYMPALFVKLDPPVEPLSDSEREPLLSWLAAGASPGDAEACPATP